VGNTSYEVKEVEGRPLLGGEEGMGLILILVLTLLLFLILLTVGLRQVAAQADRRSSTPARTRRNHPGGTSSDAKAA
jgi:hypothetical protein